MFKITGNKGFHIIFDNGITLSTQFGACNHCDNQDIGFEEEFKIKDGGYLQSSNCEIGIWNKEGWLTKKMHKAVFKKKLGNQVMGWVYPDDWAKIVRWCVRQKINGGVKC